MDALALQGVKAIEWVSGCRVRKLYRDAALLSAPLDCGQRLAPLPRGNTFDCDVYDVVDGLAELNCRATRL
jgi:hypothetical protein